VGREAARRQFRAEYKAGILAEHEKAGRGEQGALLRREGLYSSHIDAWRKLSEAGVLSGLAPTKRGRKPKVVNPLGSCRHPILTNSTTPGVSRALTISAGPGS
jgi:hypothetical protein